ncbi:dihydroneopterin aldolase [Carboxydocella sporoproducens DSM 16521]|uniref:7,8-dihydroneopterin aldolase n=2 Tax=Carboxydocella TaxID=178898 RepID=A0A1T4RKL5_9FIRM|nr:MULTISPECIES: dihydroneopterin aldolase [Carboxydocella]AVX19308.1 dihydroneopterin aldolase [Carboxydocella thermautotrophica]AVX29722.1 dihydroneopterin aldolase [Carboxydocella thermautotrophica]SKA16522.1 dihydroneopterin aldolase [Carboxydocella sporoproducens DSM 16521]
MDRILIRDIEFYGYHGVLPEEKRLGQRFAVDLDLYLALAPAGQEDNLERTVNYAEIVEKVVTLGQAKSFNLIEALAEAIAAEMLCYPVIEKVRVLVKKPQAPIPRPFGLVAVEIERSRG